MLFLRYSVFPILIHSINFESYHFMMCIISTAPFPHENWPMSRYVIDIISARHFAWLRVLSAISRHSEVYHPTAINPNSNMMSLSIFTRLRVCIEVNL